MPLDSANSTVPRRLGDYLRCPQETLRQAVERQINADDRRRLGDFLLESGHVSQESLREALRLQRRDRLKSCTLFGDLTQPELDQVCAIVEEVSVPGAGKFIDQDTPGDCFYVIASGSVSVYGEYLGDDGKSTESPLATLFPGEMIGEMGYFSDGKRTASAKALEPVELLRLPYETLPRVFALVPNLANGFLTIVTHRLRELNSQYHTTVHHRHVAERSLRYLSDYLDGSTATDLSLDLEQGIEALIKRLVSTASKIMNADRASLFLVDPATGDLWSKVAEGENSREIRIRAGHGLAGWVVQHGQILNIPDAYHDSRFNQEVDRRTGYRTKAILCGPVRNLQGQTIGVIQVINKIGDGIFGDADEAIFKAFAHQAAIAVENFNLFQRLKGSHEKMALMLDVATSVTQTLDLPLLIKKIVTKVQEILNCDRASFFVYDRQTDELWSMEAGGAGVKEIRFPASSGIAGYTARTGEVVNIPDAYQDFRFNPAFDKQMNYRTRTVLCVPVLDRDDNVSGVTQAINKDGGPFTAEDVSFLRAISSQIGVAVANAQLYANTAAMKNYLQSVQQSISNAILTLNDSWKVVTLNKAATHLLGTPADQCVEHDLRQSLGAPNLTFVNLVERAYAAGGQAGAIGYDVDLELPHSPKKGGVVNVNILPLQPTETQATSDDQKSNGLVVVMEDVTREKRAVGTLSRYVAKEVAEQILADPDRLKLGGTRVKATILFSDLRDFTGRTEAMTAEDTVDLLNGYFTVMVEEVLGERGMLDKFIGDAVMALFGVPFLHEDDAVRAVRAALRMGVALREFNAGLVARNLRPIDMGIGISTGEVVCGNIGSLKHMNFTVIGDEVNTASRLEGLNKYYGTKLLVSQSTRQDIGDEFTLRPVDRVLMIGKTHPMPIYEVLGPAGLRLTTSQQCFATGIESYGQRQFAQALEMFRRGATDDPVCRVFVARCEHFITHPPPADWNGVWRATGK